MFDFMKIAHDSYIMFRNGERKVDIPLSKEELLEQLANLELSEEELDFIEKFYGEGGF